MTTASVTICNRCHEELPVRESEKDDRAKLFVEDAEEFTEAEEQALRSLKASETRIVLEEFDGFVDQIDGDVASVTLKAKTGEILYGEYPASDLIALGIRERRRFTCRTLDTGLSVEIELKPIPDCEVSEDRERAIKEEIRKSLGDDDGPQDDY